MTVKDKTRQGKSPKGSPSTSVCRLRQVSLCGTLGGGWGVCVCQGPQESVRAGMKAVCKALMWILSPTGSNAKAVSQDKALITQKSCLEDLGLGERGCHTKLEKTAGRHSANLMPFLLATPPMPRDPKDVGGWLLGKTQRQEAKDESCCCSEQGLGHLGAGGPQMASSQRDQQRHQ